MEYIVIAILAATILVLVSFRTSPLFSGRKGSETPDRKTEKATGSSKPVKFCPLCNSPLAKGENVKSKVFPAVEKDSIMEVYGCPNCIPPDGRKERICPVCGKSIPGDGYVIGRYFVKPGKRHLHVLGCTLCRKAK